MKKILLDMDGVLTSFDTYVKGILGRPLRSFPTSSAGWRALGDYKNSLYLVLDPMPDAAELVEGAYALSKDYGCTLGVLTAVPKEGTVPLAEAHKREWLARYFPILLSDFNIGPHAVDKQNHCKVGDVLIDDSELNIPQWNAKGGKGILHTDAKTSLFELKTYLETL